MTDQSNVNIADSAVSADEMRADTLAIIGASLLEREGLTNRVFYDAGSKRFYVQNVDKEWCDIDIRAFSTFLKDHGFCPVVREKRDEKNSELDLALAYIALNCRVSYAGAVAGFKQGLIENNGQKILVTREAKILQPTPGDFPILYEIILRMFGEGSTEENGNQNSGPIQLPYFLGWWKHALECLHGKYMDKRCLCMVFAGEAGCGKSLLKDLISLSLGGRECKPYRFMIGQENFNGEFIGSELWVVDDEQASTRHRDRSEFGANIKKAVADRYYRIRGMMRDGVVLEMFRLPLICVNREPERLMVLPPLEDDIADKISVLLTHKHPMPMAVGTAAEKAAFWEKLTTELPHFIHWLINEYEIEGDMYGRFGVKHFHHPDLCTDLFHMSPARVLWEQIERCVKFDDLTWYVAQGSTELRSMMTDEDSSPLTRKEINDLPAPTFMGSQLTKIAAIHPERVMKKKVGGLYKWIICADGKSIDTALESARYAASGKQG